MPALPEMRVEETKVNGTGKKRVVLAGGSGFLGRALAAQLLLKDYEVVVLTRSPRAREDGVAEVAWNGKSLGDWVQCLEGAHAIVNLAGRSVNCRHTPENLREINESRINSVNAVATAIHNVAKPPRVWVQAGSLAIYGDLDDQWCEEGTPSGEGTAVETCRLWENAFKTVPVVRHAAGVAANRPCAGARCRRAFRAGKIDPLVSGRSGGQRPAIYQLDSSGGHESNVDGLPSSGTR